MISDYLRNKLIDHSDGVAEYVFVDTVYVALFKGTLKPSDTTPANEVTGGSYARVAITFAAAVEGRAGNSVKVTFPAPSADWGVLPATGIRSIALMDTDNSGGNFLYGKNVCPFEVLNNNEPVVIEIDGFMLSLGAEGGDCC